MPTRTIELSAEELASAKRLLSILTSSDREPPAGQQGAAQIKLLTIARASLAVRKRRSEYLHPAMLGEPAYDMLLALYVEEAEGQELTPSRLAEVASVAQSSATRWIEYLISKQLVHRRPHPKHRRASVITLSDKGKQALEGVFTSIIEGLHQLSF